MKAGELLQLLPKGLLYDLALQTRVDHQVKKLSGEVVFKLILFSMLNEKKLSLRVMEGFLHSACFRSFCGLGALQSRYNSIRDRICTIEASYFERVLEKVFQLYSATLGEQRSLCSVDSTYVSLAARLLPKGMENGWDQSQRFVKFTILLKGSLPMQAKVFLDQRHVSEDVALSELICDAALEHDIVVFDRGLQSRHRFDDFTQGHKGFITRGKTNTQLIVERINALPTKPSGTQHLCIVSDEEGFLTTTRQKPTRYTYRIIRARIEDSGEELCFVTNLKEENAYQVAQWYRERWQIELFFKFLKQHLNLKHLVCRTENGIKVMLYMTLILATLIQVYKKKNSIKSFKLARLQFELELENDLIQQIVKLCGGNPQKAPYLWNSS